MRNPNKKILGALFVCLALLLALAVALTAHGEAQTTKQITILHTNDFHGNLKPDSSGRGGSAYIAGKVNEIRAAVGVDNVALLDAGDVYFGGAPISSLLLGESAIDIYNMMGYDAAAYGNHEFDKGQTVLISRTNQSLFPWISANIVISGTEWEHPTWTKPYITLTLGTAGDQVVLGVLGLSTDETPVVTLKGTTEGLVFKDPTATVLHYYDELKSQCDAMVVLAHIGTADSGPYKGLRTIAQELINAGKPVDLMIGGHQHERLDTPIRVGDTAIVSAWYAGRALGRVDATVDFVHKKLIVNNYRLILINTTLTPDPAVADRVAYWANVVQPILQQPVGYTNVNLVRYYNGESNIGDLVADSMRWKADEYDDGEVNGSVDIAFTNAGGLRADIVIPAGATLPYTITWGDTFSVLPFANTLYLMDLTGWQIQALLDQAATLYKGILQSSGITWYWYNDKGAASPNAWGAYGVMVNGQPLDYKKTYRVVTNNFLAPGGDGFTTFAQGTNRWDTYYDMQQGLNEYIAMYNATVGPIDYEVEGRITKLNKVVTILHTNDEHGRAYTDTYRGNPIGLTYIASLVKHERAKNPNALLLTASDTIQGNAFAFYFRNAPGPVPGGTTTLANPMMAVMNAMGYNASTIGNHEFNFGRETFAKALGQAAFPFVAANVSDDGLYGFIGENVRDYITMTVEEMKVAIFGLTNPRVPSYELPSNIVGLTFVGGYEAASPLVPQIIADEDPDLLVGLTHLGYAPYEGSRPEDTDVFLADNVPGIDVIIGGHSHTKLDPAVLRTSITNTEGTLIAQAERHAYYLGKVNVGFVSDGVGGYQMVLREGRLLPAGLLPPDPDIETLLAPYMTELNAYTSQVIGESTVDLDARTALYEETAASNLQVDASKWALEQAGIPVDFHLSGAMTNQYVPAGTLRVQDMFTLMPYENSLVVMRMNGPQLKRVLERSFYNYDLWRRGLARYTTCFLDISAGGQIVYDPAVPEAEDNVVSLTINGVPVDFSDADTYYNVSTVNYLAAGACSYSDAGVSIWPLDQIIADTQYYVRDVVIDYIKEYTPISPQVEGRIRFLPSVTILHTNDFHGNLQPDSSGRGGSVYIAGKVNEIRSEVGADKVVLLDAGDVYFGGAPISSLLLGESAIDIYNMMGYDAAAYGNHEFDKGQTVLISRTNQSLFPWISANIVISGTEWEHPTWTKPYITLTLGTAGDQVVLGVLGLSTDETPVVTLKGTTEGLVFKDPTATVLHYYDELKSQCDAMVVLAHIGTADSGPYKGLRTIAQELINAGKPVDLMIGGHQHERLDTPIRVGDTAIVSAWYAGRALGRVDATVDFVHKKLIVNNYRLILINTTLTPDPAVADRVAYWANVVQPILQQPVGYTNVNLVRYYNGESNIGDLVADSMRWKADEYDDGEVNGSVDIAFTNAGGLRADIVIPAGATLPYTITWGDTFSVLPFANTLYLMDLTGAQIQALLNQSASLYKGMLQCAGITFKWYNDCRCNTPKSWGAFDIKVKGEPLDPSGTYRVVTNNFLAPGGDGFTTFTEGTNRWDTYYDMQQGLNEYIAMYNATVGPIDYQVEGRIQYVYRYFFPVVSRNAVLP